MIASWRPDLNDLCRAFSRFSNISLIGSGGWKIVYSFETEGTRWALLLIPLPRKGEIGDEIYTEDVQNHFRSRIEREVSILKEADCENLVKVGPHSEDPKGYCEIEIAGRTYLWFTEEFIDGDELDDLIKTKCRPDLREFLTLLENGLVCIKKLWAMHVVHRDIKPSNIMKIRSGGTVQFKFLDAGIALARLATPLTPGPEPMGTLRYMSPEQLQTRNLDWRSDLFSLSVTAYEYASGMHPLCSRDRTSNEIRTSIGRRFAPALKSIRGDIPESLSMLVSKCLNKKPILRPGSIDRLLELLNGIRREEVTQ